MLFIFMYLKDTSYINNCISADLIELNETKQI